MNKLAATLFALILLVGCSSGGGTSGGAGGAGTSSTSSGLLLSGSLTPAGSISVDAFRESCGMDTMDTMDTMSGTETFEPGLTTTTGTFTINILNLTDFTGGVFPFGVTFDTYRVSLTSETDSRAPILSPRTFAQTVTLLNGTVSATVPVILVDVGFTIPEFAASTPAGPVFSYRVTVTFFGRTLAGEPVSLAASTFIEIGNFDRC